MKDYSRIARKTTLALFAAQSLVSAALIVSGTVSAIVAVELSGREAWAGVPSAVGRLGTAFAIYLLSVQAIRLAYSLHVCTMSLEGNLLSLIRFFANSLVSFGFRHP